MNARFADFAARVAIGERRDSLHEVKLHSYGATFVRLAVSMGLLWGILWSLIFAQTVRDTFVNVFWPYGLAGGCAFGVVTGGALAFRLRSATATIPVGPDPKAFLSRLTFRLAGMSYHPAGAVGECYSFRPSFRAGWASGRITVLIHPVEVSVIGPVVHLRKLVKLLARETCAKQGPYRE
jgi:hypothetical protein